MPSICFVSFYSGRLLLLGDHAGVGGAEVQQHILAKALIKMDMRVSFIVGSEKATAGLVHEEFPVFRTYDRTGGFRFVRLIYPQFFKVWRALKKADSDYYYVRGLRVESGITWLFCVLHRRRYIAAIANDLECRADTLPSSRWNPKTILYVLGLQRAHQVFAQTEWQKAALRDDFGVDATIIKNAMPVDPLHRESGSELQRVLWVSTIVPDKRPEFYLHLALGNPSLDFTMIGPVRYGFEAYRDKIKKMASEIPNLTYIDSVNFEDIDAYYRDCDMFVFTSNHEGFPNVLLQAWASGKPVVTSFDPDGIVARHELGYVAESEDEFKKVFGEVATKRSVATLNEMGKRARSYVEEHHSPSVIAVKICEALGISDNNN